MADPVQTGTTSAQAVPATQPAPSPSPPPAQAATPPAPSPVPAATVASPAAAGSSSTPGTMTGSTAAAPATKPAWLEQFRTAGVQLPDSETEAIQALARSHQQAQQFQQVQPHFQTYLQHAAAFHQWQQQQLQQRQQPAGQQPAANDPYWKQYWNAPEFNPAWEQMVVRNTDGSLQAAPGAPPDTVGKLLTYQSWHQQQLRKLTENPFTFLEPAIKHIATEQAKQIAAQQLEQFQAQREAASFADTNHWLYEKDNSGGIRMQQIFDPATGGYQHQRVFSPAGARFSQLVQEEARRQNARGYFDIEEQKRFAMLQLRDEIGQGRVKVDQAAAGTAPAAPAAPQTPLDAANAAFLQQHGRAGTPATPPSSATAPAPVTKGNMTQTMLERVQSLGGIG